jgi:DNA-binding transcriptional LysR family regulator
MDLALLAVFREVAVRGSLTAAAQALGYTQPAVSRQISALEKATGARLLDRLPRGVRLTEEGHCLLAHAEVVLERMRTAQQALEDIRDLRAGRLRAGAFDSADAALVPRALASFRAAHPRIVLSVVEGTTPALLSRLQNGEIDVAVISAYPSQTLDTSHLALHHLLDDPLSVALPASHRLAEPGSKSLRLAELAGETWIEGFTDSSQTLIDACIRAGFRPQIDFTVREWTAKQGFVAAGLGLALVPRLAASALRPGIVLRPLHADDAPVRHVYASTWRAIVTPPSVAAFLRCLETVAGTFATRVTSAADVSGTVLKMISRTGMDASGAYAVQLMGSRLMPRWKFDRR